jgi:hypothetical protein
VVLALRKGVASAQRSGLTSEEAKVPSCEVGGLWVFLTRLDKYFPLLAALRITCTRVLYTPAVRRVHTEEKGFRYWDVRSATLQWH